MGIQRTYSHHTNQGGGALSCSGGSNLHLKDASRQRTMDMLGQRGVKLMVDWLWFNVTFSDISATVVLPNLELLLGIQHFNVQSLPNTGNRTSEDVFNVLAIRGPTRGKGMQGMAAASYERKLGEPTQYRNAMS